MADKTYWAWSPIRNGGEVKMVPTASGHGAERAVVTKRNVIPVGDKVAKGDVDNFDELVDAGAIRPYPYPEGLNEDSLESPINFLRRRLRERVEQEMSEEEGLLLAAGMGAVISDEELATTQPDDAKKVKAATNQ